VRRIDSNASRNAAVCRPASVRKRPVTRDTHHACNARPCATAVHGSLGRDTEKPVKNTIAMLVALVASATFAGCADMNTKHPNATAGGAARNAAPMCSADGAPDDALIGKTEAEATALLDGCLWRVLERDGKSLPGTMDYREERRDLGIRDGKVIWVRRG